MKIISVAFACLLASTSIIAQDRIAFEVASIKPTPEDSPTQVTAGVRIDGAQVRASRLSVKDYIAIAYRLKIHQVTGPEWLGSARFEIVAKLPEGSSPTQVPEMLQTLLADRFGMKMHRETRDFPVYTLEVAKSGLQLKEAPSDESETSDKTLVNVAGSGSSAGISVSLGKGSFYRFADNRFEAKKISMTALADTLGRFADRPVVDKTGLSARCDIDFNVSPEDYREMLIRAAVAAGAILPPQALRMLDMPMGDSLFEGMRKVGLSLTASKSPIEVLVVDSIQKAPTNN